MGNHNKGCKLNRGREHNCPKPTIIDGKVVYLLYKNGCRKGGSNCFECKLDVKKCKGGE